MENNSNKEKILERKRKARAKRGGRAATAAERVHDWTMRQNELDEIPPPKKIEIRNKCRFDFVEFVVQYGSCLLKHQPSELMKKKFLIPLQESILNGGQYLIMMPRGKGKTTFIILANAWAILYGHKKFTVSIAATGQLGKTILKNTLAVFDKYNSPRIAEDFPEVVIPLSVNAKKLEYQTYNGFPTKGEIRGIKIKIPTLIDNEADPIGDAHGAVITCVGVGGAVRGLNEMGKRPDMIFFDDIQKRKDAKSPALTEALEEFMTQDALGLFGHDDVKTSLMALTPICEGDFASLLNDPERHPELIRTIQPLVIKWPTRKDLVDEYFRLYREDCAADDFARSRSTKFFEENKEQLWQGVELLDNADGANGEIDALHHVLNLVAIHGMDAFNAEYQMQVRAIADVVEITADRIKHALNGFEELVLPNGTDECVAFCDLNIKKSSGLRYGVLACGAGRTAAVIHYGRFPEEGKRLFPETTPESERPPIIADAMRTVMKRLMNLNLRNREGKPRKIIALCFDGGNWTRTVARAVIIMKKVDRPPFQVFWSLGRNWSKFNDERKIGKTQRGDHIFATSSINGKHLVMHTDYWREMAQTSFLKAPLTSGSVSLFGSDSWRHDEFAREVSAEQLVRKFIRPDGRLEWDWAMRGNANHWGDVLTGCFMVASWMHIYDSDEKSIDLSLLKNKESFAQNNKEEGQETRDERQAEKEGFKHKVFFAQKRVKFAKCKGIR